MFKREEKPLPQAVLRVVHKPPVQQPEETGIVLGVGCLWNPETLPNGHVVTIGGSGSGKTQTLKALVYELFHYYPDLQIVVVDFHGDQDIAGEVCYPLHMSSQWGINPLMVNLDPEGGGPAIAAITIAQNLKKNLQLGPNQEGLLLEIFEGCYASRGILQSNPATWKKEPPNFSDLRAELEQRAQGGCKESSKLKLKLAATFQYGVFNRPTFPLDARLTRVDLCKLPPEVGAIAAEALGRVLMDSHRLHGEIKSKIPKTYLAVDEAKELSKSPALDRIIADGRKYGLNLILASQSERHLSADVIGNSATKIVLPVDQTEVAKVGKKFRFDEKRVAGLDTLQALCRFGTEAKLTEIIPYYRRIEDV